MPTTWPESYGPLLLATGLGVVVPVVIASVAERLRWHWVFGLPQRAEGAFAR